MTFSSHSIMTALMKCMRITECLGNTRLKTKGRKGSLWSVVSESWGKYVLHAFPGRRKTTRMHYYMAFIFLSAHTNLNLQQNLIVKCLMMLVIAEDSRYYILILLNIQY